MSRSAPSGRPTRRRAGPPRRSAAFSYGRGHFWLAPPLQSRISSWVLLVVVDAGSSRRRPDWTLLRLPLACASHCWLAPPLQSQSSTRVPLAVFWPVTSMHLPLICTVPLATV